MKIHFHKDGVYFVWPLYCPDWAWKMASYKCFLGGFHIAAYGQYENALCFLVWPMK